jgi:hypothetical protein
MTLVFLNPNSDNVGMRLNSKFILTSQYIFLLGTRDIYACLMDD